MNAAIVMERPGGVERADGLGLVGGTELDIVGHRRARLLLGVGRVAIPGAIGNDMDRAGLVVQRNAIAFFDRDTILGESRSGQAHSVAATAPIAASTTTGNHEYGKKREKR